MFRSNGGKMKRLAALALVAVLGSVGFGSGYFLGLEVIPHTFGSATYGIPYVGVGYDSGWGFAGFYTNSPLTMNAWYLITAGGKYALTENLAVTGAISVWPKFDSFVLADGRWSFSLGGQYTWNKSIGLHGKVHLPFAVDPSVPFWGAWITIGIQFYPWAWAPTE